MMSNARLIVVLGMHRSGTSAVTRGLQTMGVELGNRLMPAVEENNEKGFWEDIDLNTLNIEMLEAIGSDWYHLAPVEHIDVVQLIEKGFRDRAVELLRRKTDNVRVFGYKDPRVAKLMPFWEDVFSHCELDVDYVLVVRHPLSVARSLAKRDNIGTEQSYLLWLGYVVACLSAVAESVRVVVDYDCLMQSPEKELKRLAKNLDLTIDMAELKSYTYEFLDEGLRHTVFGLNDLMLDENCPPVVREVYLSLSDVAKDKTRLGEVTLMDRIGNWADEFQRLKSPLKLIDRLSGTIDRQKYEHSEKIAEFNRMIEDRDGQIENFNQAVIDRDGRIKDLYHDLVERDNEIATIKAKLTERDKQIEKLQDTLEKLQDTLIETQASLNHAQDTVSLVTSSTSWRMTSGLRWLGSRLRAMNPLQATRNLVTGDLTHKLFRILPLSIKTKRVIKDIVFRYAGFLFRHDPAFLIWQEKRRPVLSRKECW